jgi:tRNA A58 N-methylase Trm61
VTVLSPRLSAIVDALPLEPGLRVIEIGCGPGAAAREVANRVGPSGHVLAVDRSAKAIAQLTESAGPRFCGVADDNYVSFVAVERGPLAAGSVEPGEERAGTDDGGALVLDVAPQRTV